MVLGLRMLWGWLWGMWRWGVQGEGAAKALLCCINPYLSSLKYKVIFFKVCSGTVRCFSSHAPVLGTDRTAPGCRRSAQSQVWAGAVVKLWGRAELCGAEDKGLGCPLGPSSSGVTSAVPARIPFLATAPRKRPMVGQWLRARAEKGSSENSPVLSQSAPRRWVLQHQPKIGAHGGGTWVTLLWVSVPIFCLECTSTAQSNVGCPLLPAAWLCSGCSLC